MLLLHKAVEHNILKSLNSFRARHSETTGGEVVPDRTISEPTANSDIFLVGINAAF